MHQGALGYARMRSCTRLNQSTKHCPPLAVHVDALHSVFCAMLLAVLLRWTTVVLH